MADDSTTIATTVSSPVLDNDPLLRPVILETSKETYLLSPNIISSVESSPTLAAPAERVYDIALILETEVVVEDEPVAEAEVEVVTQPKATAGVDPIEPAAPVPAADDKEKVATEVVADPATKKDSDDQGPKEAAVAPPPVAEKNPAAAAAEPVTTAPSVEGAAAEANPAEPSSTGATKDTTVQPDTPPKPKMTMVEPGSSPLPPSRASPVHSPEPEHMHGHDHDHEAPPSSPLPTDNDNSMLDDKDNNNKQDNADKASLLEDGDIPKPQLSVQVLQRNLARSMFRFENDSVYVKDPSGDGMEAEWAIQVKNWKWAPKGARERLIDAV